MTSPFWKQVKFANNDSLRLLPAESRDVIVVSTWFKPRDKFVAQPSQSHALSEDSIRLLEECARVLKFGGVLFVYGIPRDLAFWGQRLSFMGNQERTMLFKYWIALEIDGAKQNDFLKPAHQGLLMFLKSKANAQSPSSFRLNTSIIKVPHAFCAACGKNVKDWGGKKHLMNPNGTALSDVWRDLPKIALRDFVAPKTVLKRIRALTEFEGSRGLHVIERNLQPSGGLSSDRREEVHSLNSEMGQGFPAPVPTVLERDKVYLGDCVAFLKRVETLHPEGVFDLAFADPPYNLQKLYSNHDDALAEQHYIEWCNRWLDGMARTLKPGGSLFVLNLPKWAIHHAAFLNQRLEFRHWIAWDALADPRGKLMPAHYALLYYTKPGGKPVFNYSPVGAKADGEKVSPPDSPKYCLRANCVRQRKQLGDDDKVELSDIWFDIHRIKHKRDRDAHPCQLPEKLMERIIRLTTHRGELVFDPFCGAGTTAIAAMKLGRRFVVVDCDANYVRITNEKLAAMKRNAERNGCFIVPRIPTRKNRTANSKKAVEIYLQGLTRRLGKLPTEQDVETDKPEMLRAMDSLYPYRSAALKRCKVVLAETAAR